MTLRPILDWKVCTDQEEGCRPSIVCLCQALHRILWEMLLGRHRVAGLCRASLLQIYSWLTQRANLRSINLASAVLGLCQPEILSRITAQLQQWAMTWLKLLENWFFLLDLRSFRLFWIGKNAFEWCAESSPDLSSKILVWCTWIQTGLASFSCKPSYLRRPTN